MLANKDVIVVGAGRVGRRLAHELHPERALVVVDISPERLDCVPDAVGRLQVTKVLGDATSRLVLERAGASMQTTVVVATGDDAVNREVARLCREDFEVQELVCLLYGELEREETWLTEADVIHRHQACSALVLNRLNAVETRGVALGLGLGELRQVSVMEGSAAAGRALSEIHPHRWLVAAVYRDERLIVPHGQTILQPGDRVLLVGQPAVLGSVAAFIRGGRPTFPTQYGEHIGVLGGDAVREEATFLQQQTLAQDPFDLNPAELHPGRVSEEQIGDRLEELNVGCVVIDPVRISWAARVGFLTSTRKKFVLAAHVPVLVARGTAPYGRILLAVGPGQDPDLIAQVSIDLARQCKAQLTVLTVLPPSFAEGEDEVAPLKALPGRVAHLARLHGVEVDKRLEHGNPIERIRHTAKDFDLLVIGHSRQMRNTLFTPDVSLFLLHDAPCSVMFVPWNAAHT